LITHRLAVQRSTPVVRTLNRNRHWGPRGAVIACPSFGSSWNTNQSMLDSSMCAAAHTRRAAAHVSTRQKPGTALHSLHINPGSRKQTAAAACMCVATLCPSNLKASWVQQHDTLAAQQPCGPQQQHCVTAAAPRPAHSQNTDRLVTHTLLLPHAAAAAGRLTPLHTADCACCPRSTPPQQAAWLCDSPDYVTSPATKAGTADNKATRCQGQQQPL
jgi:hypothetical protein